MKDQYTHSILALNEAIGCAQSPEELLSVIKEEVAKYVEFYDTGVLLVDESGDFHYDLAISIPGWDMSESNVQLQNKGILKHPHRGSNLEWVMQDLDQKKVEVYNYKEMQKHIDHANFQTMIDSGIKEGLAVLLKAHGRKLGVFFLNSTEENYYSHDHKAWIKIFGQSISIAVTNIMANEKLRESAKEKSILLSISNDIAKVRSTKDLLKVINDKIKTLIPFYDTGVIIVEPNGEFHYDLAVTETEWDGSEGNLRLQNMGFGLIPHRGSFIEKMMQKLERQDCILINDYNEIFSKYEYPFFEVMKEMNYQTALVTTLQNGGNTFGTFWLNSLEKGTFSTYQFDLFKSIANQVAIAVANILANKEIIEQEREKALLLSLSEDMATIRNKEDLWKTMMKKIKPIIGFDDAVVAIFSPDGKYSNHILTISPNERKSHKMYNKIVGVYTLVEGSPIEYLQNQENIYPWELSHLLSRYPNYPGLLLMKDTGLNFTWSFKLSWGNKDTGQLHLHFKSKDKIRQEKYGLYKAIADQVSLAMANIMANEEILAQKTELQKREKEKSKLLELSDELTKVKDRNELMRIVLHKVKTILPFETAGLFLLNSSKDEIVEILNEQNHPNPLQIALSQKELLGPWKLSDSHPKSWWMKNEITIGILDQESILSKGKEWEMQFKLAVEYGLKSFIGGPLISKNEVIGAICFNSFETDFFNDSDKSLFKSISEMVGTALSNILSFETIQQNNWENQQLIEINELIAGIKTPDGLLKVIIDKIKPIFNFYDCGLFIIDEAGEYHVDWAVDLIDVSPSEWNNTLRDQVQRYRTKNSPTEYLLFLSKKSQSPVIVDFKELVEKFPNFPQFVHFDVLSAGYRDCLSYPLKMDGELKGLFCINALKRNFFNSDQFPFFQSICHSLSIAVKNVLEHEKLLEDKKIKNFQLEINDIFSSENSSNEKWTHFFKSLNKILPFNFAFIKCILPQEKFFAVEQIGIEEYRFLDQTQLMQVLGLNWKQLHQLNENDNFLENAFFQENEMENLSSNSRWIKQLKSISKASSLLHYNLKFNGSVACELFLFDRSISPYAKKHLEVLNKICMTLGLSLEKSLALEEIKALSSRLELEKGYLMEEVNQNFNFGEIIGTSESLHHTLMAIKKVAHTDTTVLIEGETGTGKELIARALHQYSNRKEKPLIKVNCAALPPHLIESELFGHEKGSFTGATDKRIGKFELAHKGTLFLDEIGELPLELQPKLLRALQEREIERVGGSAAIPLDVRIVAATNRNLELEVKKGNFRADLFYRLNVFSIYSAPLRERKEDIPALAQFFSQNFMKKLGKEFQGFSKRSVQMMESYAWPGNIRELQNVIEQAIITSEGKLIDCEPYFIGKKNTPHTTNEENTEKPFLGQSINEMENALKNLERKHIIQSLESTNYRIRGAGGAAELLDVHPNTLESRIKKLGIKKMYG